MLSVYEKNIKKFKSIRRGYYSLILISIFYFLSFVSELFISNKALIVKFDGNYYFPQLKFYPCSQFGMNGEGEANYRQLKSIIKETNEDNWVLLPIYPYGPNENLLNELNENPPTKPTAKNIMGTDDRGRDVLARLVSGFFISLSFGVLVTFLSFVIGIASGILLGYYGGITDLIGLRFIEIWQTLPVIYIIMILSVLLTPGFFTLTILLTIFGWMGITYYVRGEVYKEKENDYIIAAKASGLSDFIILIKHLLPNTLVSVISFIPFAVVGNIIALVSLDFLGLGIPQPAPSWGNLLYQGTANLNNWWLLLFPIIAQFVTLLLIVFTGEAFRESFDPKNYNKY